jgi:hypothetical protein
MLSVSDYYVPIAQHCGAQLHSFGLTVTDMQHTNAPYKLRSTTANTPSPYTHCLLALLAVLAGVAVVAHHVVVVLTAHHQMA